MRWIWYRSYYSASAIFSLLLWIIKGAKTSPDIGVLGKTRWRCACCMWRHRMAWADYRLGLEVTPQQALKERIDKSWYGETKQEVLTQQRELPSWISHQNWKVVQDSLDAIENGDTEPIENIIKEIDNE